MKAIEFVEGERPSFRHSGKLGDIVYSLPAVRALGGGGYYLHIPSPYGLDEFQASVILPLLRAQPYITGAKLWSGQPYTYDLDCFRSQETTKHTLVEAHLLALGLSAWDPEMPWLNVPFKKHRHKVLFARSTHRPGPSGFWHEAYSRLAHLASFVGTKDEHEAFCREIGQVGFSPTTDLLELAELINGARLFVGNQSCPFAIAEALKIPAILEVDAGAMNCVYRRKSALHVITAEDVANIASHAERWLSRRRGAPNAVTPTAPPVIPVQERSVKETQKRLSHPDEHEAFLVERVRPEHRVVIFIGTGAARLADIVKQSDVTREVWAVDTDPASKGQYRRSDRLLIGRPGHLTPLPIPLAKFDCILITDSVDSLQAPVALTAQLQSHLAPEGSLVCHSTNASHWFRIVRLLEGRAQTPSLESSITPALLEKILWDGGFGVIHTEDWEWDDNAAVTALSEAAAKIGIEIKNPPGRLSIVRFGFEAKRQPDPFGAEKRQLLAGPYCGKLAEHDKRCSIVIVAFNSAETLPECLDSILPTISGRDEIIVVDNASSDSTIEVLDRYRGGDARIHLKRNSENLGFSRACNQGILDSHGEFIILLNPDTVVSAGWIEGLVTPLCNAEIGAVGPVCDRVSGDQFVRFHLPANHPDLQIGELSHFLSSTHGSEITVTKLLIGFCLAISRTTLNEYGLLDEAMFLGSEDVELSWRLRTFGLQLVIAKGVFVQHHTGRSFRSLDKETSREYRSRSDAALLAKLRAYYPDTLALDSNLIWGNNIFQHMLER